MEKVTTSTLSQQINKTVYSSSQLSMFNVLKELETNTKLLNIWRSYTIRPNVKNSIVYFDLYTVESTDWWENISAKIYGTVTYWWTIALVNNVINPFEELVAGTQIRYLKPKYLYQLIKEVKVQSIL